MHKNKIIITLGVVIALLPFLGFPGSWEAAFEVIAGLSIVLISVMTAIDKRISQKDKARKRQARKRMIDQRGVQEERRIQGDRRVASVPFSPQVSENVNILDTNTFN